LAGAKFPVCRYQHRIDSEHPFLHRTYPVAARTSSGLRVDHLLSENAIIDKYDINVGICSEILVPTKTSAFPSTRVFLQDTSRCVQGKSAFSSLPTKNNEPHSFRIIF
jgi:hypothetical protein